MLNYIFDLVGRHGMSYGGFFVLYRYPLARINSGTEKEYETPAMAIDQAVQAAKKKQNFHNAPSFI